MNLFFVMSLLLVFAVSSVMVILFGARAYLTVVQSAERTFTAHTSLDYVKNKIRHYDARGRVYLDTFGDSQALVLEEEYNGVSYEIWIYYHSGSLRELFARKETIKNFTPDAGQPILELEDFTVSREAENLLCLTVTDSAHTATQLYVSLHSSRGAC